MPSDNQFDPISQEVLSADWGTLTKHTFALKRRDGDWQQQTRECYDRGNGATCLLFNPAEGTVLLTRQFRLPVYLNAGPAAFIETPAGLLDGADPAERMRKELIEETGYHIAALEHLYNVYMSPGSVTEYLAFFVGIYGEGDHRSSGGGVVDEGEDIQTLHVPLADAIKMIETGDIQDAKTIILLQHLWIKTPAAT